MRNVAQRFLKLEAASGIILLFVTALAMAFANSPLAYWHQQFIDTFIFTINDGLMVIFFLLVGLELKRGFLDGEMGESSQIVLPAVGALGGMLIPALIYITINYHNPILLKGWATPVATDIAFAIAILSLFGNRVPSALKLFLISLAIFDDIGAIIIITLFYSEGISYLPFFMAALITIGLIFLNRFAVEFLWPYLVFGVLLWLCLLSSGIHPTISGIILAFALPNSKKDSPSSRLENNLHPWVAYLIMPLFAFANAGLSFKMISVEHLFDGVVIGITAGLFFGKQIGVFGFSWLMIRCRFAQLPEKTSWLAFYGIALICGIGFTMALFLGTLSFQHENIYITEVRLGVIIGSFLSGLVGALVLFIAFARKHNNHRSRILG